MSACVREDGRTRSSTHRQCVQLRCSHPPRRGQRHACWKEGSGKARGASGPHAAAVTEANAPTPTASDQATACGGRVAKRRREAA
eukprot:2798015-Rhodomonas_salina.1